ncbi:phage tail protein, partial [Yersinia enterocolitica]|nr:phage tail protein [Yersinia enterocolitica]
FENDSVLAWFRNTDWAKIGFKNDGDSDTDSFMWFETGDNGNEYFKWRHKISGGSANDWMTLKSDALRVAGSVIAGSWKGLAIGTSNNSTLNAKFRLWGNSSRPTVVELADDTGWHLYSQRNTDNSVTFAVNGQVIPGNYGNFDARYQA